MNVPLEQFGDLPTMDQVLSCLQLPQELLFVRGRRPATGSHQWAPASFLASAPFTGSSTPLGKQTENGFVVHLASIEIKDQAFFQPNTRMDISTSSHNYLLAVDPDEEAAANIFDRAEMLTDAVILLKKPKASFSDYTSKTGIAAVVASIYADSETATRLHYEFSGTLYRKDKNAWGMVANALTFIQASGEYSEEQDWYIN